MVHLKSSRPLTRRELPCGAAVTVATGAVWLNDRTPAGAGGRRRTGRSAFTPGERWVNTNGRIIQAHGGHLLPAIDDHGRRMWYWYGEDRSNGYHDSPGIHVYSSSDLYTWNDCGLALRNMTSYDQFDSDIYFGRLYRAYSHEQRAAVWRDLSTYEDPGSSRTPAVLERPKVIHNKRTGQWVMWVHADGPTNDSDAQYDEQVSTQSTSVTRKVQ